MLVKHTYDEGQCKWPFRFIGYYRLDACTAIIQSCAVPFGTSLWRRLAAALLDSVRSYDLPGLPRLLVAWRHRFWLRWRRVATS